MIVFTTQSGTVYHLDPDTSQLARISDVGLTDINTGQERSNTAEFFEVVYESEPTIGECFRYYHPIHFGCMSTPVVSVETVES